MVLNDEVMVNQKSKHEEAYKEIKRSILNGSLKPNTLLVERRLSEALNISRTPIRQVLQQLATEGFVEYVANKGMFVTEFNLLDSIEIYTIREVLDPLMLEGCFVHNYQIVLEQLEQALEKQRESLHQDNVKEHIKNDLSFHNVIIYNSTYKRLESFMLSMGEQIKRCAYISEDRERAAISIEQHKKVFEAYKERDIIKAKELLAEHMRSIKQYYLTKIG